MLEAYTRFAGAVWGQDDYTVLVLISTIAAMADQRFPRRKYAHQLAVIERELDDWYVSYRHAAAAHPDDWLGSRFEARAAVLDEVRRQLGDIREALNTFPRVR